MPNVLSGSKEPGFSQAWQDWFMYRNLFAGQPSGLYVGIGTNDALAISNTAFFDVLPRYVFTYFSCVRFSDEIARLGFHAWVDLWLSQVKKVNQAGFDFCPKTCPSAAP